jgi:hypothetical protein
MAHPSKKIIETLRKTADKILESHDYQWGHMGACNCGYLAQSITMKSKAEIHKRAMFGNGDWNEQLNDYCPTSGLPFDEVVAEMLDMGFDIDDLKHLERLSDKRVLARMPFPAYLKQNVKEDVALYLTLWSDLIEEQLMAQTQRMRQFDRITA